MQAVNRGDPMATTLLAWQRADAGGATGADRLRRFGLTSAGEVATELDFGF